MEIEIVPILMTIIVGLGLIGCGFILSRDFWMGKGMEFVVEKLLQDKIIAVKSMNDGTVEFVRYVDKDTNVE